MARGRNRDASIRCTTSTPSAITRPLPLGRSGLRSTLLRSRKSSSLGSAGSATSITAANPPLASLVPAGRRSRAFVDDARHQIGRHQQRVALVGLETVEAVLEPLLAGSTLGLDQVGAGPRHRYQHLTAVGRMRVTLDET